MTDSDAESDIYTVLLAMVQADYIEQHGQPPDPDRTMIVADALIDTLFFGTDPQTALRHSIQHHGRLDLLPLVPPDPSPSQES